MLTRKLFATFLLCALGATIVLSRADLVAPQASAPSLEWEQRYQGSWKWGQIEEVIITSDGGLLLETFSGYLNWYNLTFIKTDNSGELQWSKSWDSYAELAIQTYDGGYAFTRANLVTAYGTDNEFYNVTLIKLHSDGSDDWSETYHFAQSQTWTIQSDSSGTRLCNRTAVKLPQLSIYDTVETSDYGYASVARNRTESDRDLFSDLVLIREDANGNLLWTKDYPRNITGRRSEESRIIQTNDGGFLLSDTALPQILIKTDSNGSVEWTKELARSSLFVSSIVQTSDGGIALGGNAGDRYAIMKTDSSGSIEWTQEYGEIQWSEVMFDDHWFNRYASYTSYCLIETSDGSLLTAGVRQIKETYTDYAFFLAKTVPCLPEPTPAPSTPPPSTAPTQTPLSAAELQIPWQTSLPIAIAVVAVSAAVLAVGLRKRRKTI